MQVPEPQKQHLWLQRLVGEWTFETECSPGPDQPPMKMTGTETVRTLGGLWTIGEGEGEMPGGGSCRSSMRGGMGGPPRRLDAGSALRYDASQWTCRFGSRIES